MISYQNDIDKCLEVLTGGGLILYPTDTVWGIGCDATNAVAIDKIYQLKKRPDKKAMIIMVAQEQDISNYAGQPSPGTFEYLKTTLKPTTVIYNTAKNLPSNIVSDDGSIAIRIVRDEFCASLLHQFRKPIVSTSANLSGTLTPTNFVGIQDEIKSGVDYIVQHRQNDLNYYASSSIVRFNSKGELEIIRH